MGEEESKNAIRNATNTVLNPNLWRSQIILNKQLAIATPDDVDITYAPQPAYREKKSTKPKPKREKSELEKFLTGGNSVKTMKDKAETKLKTVYSPNISYLRKKKSKKSKANR